MSFDKRDYRPSDQRVRLGGRRRYPRTTELKGRAADDIIRFMETGGDVDKPIRQDKREMQRISEQMNFDMLAPIKQYRILSDKLTAIVKEKLSLQENPKITEGKRRLSIEGIDIEVKYISKQLAEIKKQF